MTESPFVKNHDDGEPFSDFSVSTKPLNFLDGGENPPTLNSKPPNFEVVAPRLLVPDYLLQSTGKKSLQNFDLKLVILTLTEGLFCIPSL